MLTIVLLLVGIIVSALWFLGVLMGSEGASGSELRKNNMIATAFAVATLTLFVWLIVHVSLLFFG